MEDDNLLYVSRDSLSGALATLAWVFQGGRRVVTVERRGGPVREFNGPAVVCIEKPWQNLPFLRGRRYNPWATLCEFPWLLAGRNDVAWLLPYQPRAADFSDDGKTWRAGYGPRLHHDGQLEAALNELAAESLSRQAVVSLWDVEAEAYHLRNGGTRDMPCTNRLHFQVRRGRLDLQVDMRSNDLIWGFSGVNVFNWTTLLAQAAAITDQEVGRYFHVAGNLHVYERHWARLPEMVVAPDPYEEWLWADRPTLRYTFPNDFEDAVEAAREAVATVELHRELVADASVGELVRLTDGCTFQHRAKWYERWAYFMLLHPAWQQGNRSEAFWTEALEALAPDWQLFLGAYMARTRPALRGWFEDLVGEVIGHPPEGKVEMMIGAEHG